MRKALPSIAITLCCAILAMVLMAAPAAAQATRTWVSGVGDDANPCSRTAPCKTFAGAISKTAAGGEINVLDPGGFGGVTITKAITISSVGFEAGVLVSGTNGIVISAGANDKVVLEGLDIEGLGTGLDGIKILSGLEVYVLRCKIHAFTGDGINMASSTSGARVFVKDSIVINNGTLNAGNGGININGTANIGTLVDTIVDSNQNFAIQANGPNNIVSATRLVLNNSPTAVSVLNNAKAYSFGPSNVVSGGGSFTTLPFE